MVSDNNSSELDIPVIDSTKCLIGGGRELDAFYRIAAHCISNNFSTAALDSICS